MSVSGTLRLGSVSLAYAPVAPVKLSHRGGSDWRVRGGLSVVRERSIELCRFGTCLRITGAQERSKGKCGGRRALRGPGWGRHDRQPRGVDRPAVSRGGPRLAGAETLNLLTSRLEHVYELRLSRDRGWRCGKADAGERVKLAHSRAHAVRLALCLILSGVELLIFSCSPGSGLFSLFANTQVHRHSGLDSVSRLQSITNIHPYNLTVVSKFSSTKHLPSTPPLHLSANHQPSK